MEATQKLKVAISKLGAELKRATRNIQSVEQMMQDAMATFVSAAENVEVVKEQLRRIRDTWEVVHREIRDMEEMARLEQSLNDEDFTFEEEEEEAGENEEVQSGQEAGGGEIEQEVVDMNE